MTSQLLKSFIVGSSFPIFLPFFYAVSQFDSSFFNFEYKNYTFIAPLFLGLANVVFLVAQNVWEWSDSMRFFLMGTLTPMFVLAIVYTQNIYTYTSSDWLQHIWKMFLTYGIVCNVMIPFIESNI